MAAARSGSKRSAPLTTDTPKIIPLTYRASKPDESIRARKEQVFATVGKEGGQNWWMSARTRVHGEDSGRLRGFSETAQRAGHIPGANNIPWAQAANEDGTFKSADALKHVYQSRGIDGRGEIIAYCRIGERSSHTWFVLKYLLGYKDVKNDGSWMEWGNLISVPIKKEAAAT